MQKPNIIKLFFFVSAYCLLSCSLAAQSVWPTDISDNGRVNGVDLLYWAYGFGETGPERSPMSSSWAPQPMPEAWDGDFPTGANLAYGDASGNGKIGMEEIELLTEYYGRSHNNSPVDRYYQPDTLTELPLLRMTSAGIELGAEIDYLLLDVLLEHPDSIDYFYGLSFEASYDENVFQAGLNKLDPRNSGWIQGVGTRLVGLMHVDSAAQRINFAITRFNHSNSSPGSGLVAQLKIPLLPGVTESIETLEEVVIDIDQIFLVDADLNTYAARVASTSLTASNDCAFTVNPVCGQNGVTYLNPCFAEAAGVSVYTAGPCYSPGINVAAMDPYAVCTEEYDPVCGFNFQTYSNACVAEAAGVVEYQAGVCSANDYSCYDPNLIVVSAGTNVNIATGIIELNCPDDGIPVCGCDGITYPNACTAEAAGVRNYTAGGCDNVCINPADIVIEPDCADAYEPVCACTGYTYVNACFAEAAGVQSYTPGVCGTTTGWCAEAIPVSCGDYLPYETTIGAGNQISSYPGATSAAMIGPDRVYVVQKTGAGDLQIGLEIMTPGLDMDIFLLRGDCDDYVCVGASTTSNTVTNNEGILLEDAPIGTYYIVVDQQAAGEGGNYRLEVSCGYLDCSQTVPLGCGVPYSGSNLYGNDDVSLYTCGNVYNVENNGPEIVHSFTITDAGPVTISLSGLSANLELFLLSNCDRSACLEYSQNSGTNDEEITRNLPPGTYYVVVDGYNGAISDYTLEVDCDEACNLGVWPISDTPAGCGQAAGSYTFQMTGGVPSYVGGYAGPVSGNLYSHDGLFTIENLPAGNYALCVHDGNGCIINTYFEIEGGGNLWANLDPEDAGCGSSMGSLGVHLSEGTPPYTIYLSGAENATLYSNNNNFTINNLWAGDYSITILDANGCSYSDEFSIGQNNGGLHVETTPYAAECGALGRIFVSIDQGYGPYHVTLSGPVSGSQSVGSPYFNLINLAAGVYELTIVDAYGCTFQSTEVVMGTDLEVATSVTPASCGGTGAALLTFNQGTAPYTVHYEGPVSGTETTNLNQLVLGGLPAGAYHLSVWSADGCDESLTIYVANVGSDISLHINQNAATCDATGATVNLSISGGTPAYIVAYSGPVNGSISVDASGQASLDLPAGNYSFNVTDYEGCSTLETFTVDAGSDGIDLTSILQSDVCGQLNNIWNSVSGGSPPFQVILTDNCNATSNNFTFYDDEFAFNNLAPCTYTIFVTDANGCTDESTVTVGPEQEVDLFDITINNGACGGVGSAVLSIDGGVGPYTISYSGPVSNSFVTTATTYIVNNLPAGTYTFVVSTPDGCSETEVVAINNGGDLELVSNLVFTDCGLYDQIWNDILGGTAPYTVEVTRLCDGDQEEFLVEGMGFELIELIPCDYKIKVTDANGCMTMNTVTVFPYELFTAQVTDGICGQGGEILVTVMNSNATAPYLLEWSGPVGGTRTFSTATTTLTDLPAGTYTLTVTEANGCSETDTVVVEDIGSDLDLNTALIYNDCGEYNQLWNDINGGVPPFTVEVTRLCDNTIDTTFITSEIGFELFELPPCTYKVKVTDANGCMDMETREIVPSEVEIFSATPSAGPCGELGKITLNITGGQAPYELVYSGPQGGSTVVNGNSMMLVDLPGGTYFLTLIDANGCSEQEMVEVVLTSSDLEVNTSLIYNECGQYNQIWSDIIGGSAPYSVEVIRLCDSTQLTEFVTNEMGFEIPNLPPCDYKVIITDAAGCMTMTTVTVFPTPLDIFDVAVPQGACGELGQFTVTVTSGTPDYVLNYSGPLSGSQTFTGPSITITDLPNGTYTIMVSDSAGCAETDEIIINNPVSTVDVDVALIYNDCNQYNQLWNDISGGVPPYTVEVTRLCDNMIDTIFQTSENSFELFGMMPCNYKVKVTDAEGCMDMETVNVGASSVDLAMVTPNGSCGMTGFDFSFLLGTAPYTIQLIGAIDTTVTNIDGPDYFLGPIPEGDYMIMLESAEGCMQFEFINLEADGSTGTPPVAGFNLEEDNGLLFTFTNTSTDATSFVFDFGDGFSVDSFQSTYTYGAPGTYTICLTATNECASDTYCETIEASSNGDLTLDVGEREGVQNDEVLVPVMLLNGQSLASLSGSFAVEDESIAEIIGLEPGMISPLFNLNNLSFSYFADQSSGITIGEEEMALFYLRVRLLAESGTTAISLTNNPVQVEMSGVFNGLASILYPQLTPGRVTVLVIDDGGMTAELRTYWGEGVYGAEVMVTNDETGESEMVVSDANGLAQVDNAGLGEMYYVDVSKDDNYENGLSTFGLFLGQRYLLGFPTPQILSPYQMIAADANCNNNVSVLDLFLIQSVLIGDLTELPDCPSWVFVHESSEMPADWNVQNIFPYVDQAAIQLEQDTVTRFVGVKIGDLLGQASPTEMWDQANDDRGLAYFDLVCETPAEVQRGETVSLRIQSEDFRNLASLQFALQFDEQQLEYLGASSSLSNLLLSERRVERAELRASWFSTDANGTNQSEDWLELHFRARTDIDDWSTMLELLEGEFHAEAYRADGQPLTPRLQLLANPGEGLPPAQLVVEQNAPNPFAETTFIGLELPTEGMLKLELTDQLGRQLLERNQFYPAGSQRMELNLRQLPAGQYYYRITFGGETVVKALQIRR
ncbi:MAG: Kazal-type serine protease inhibitor domain-containing protein [Bacteroidota bacterium]